jgi:hypothetical protein
MSTDKRFLKNHSATGGAHQILQSPINNSPGTSIHSCRRSSSVCAQDLLGRPQNYNAQMYRDAAEKCTEERLANVSVRGRTGRDAAAGTLGDRGRAPGDRKTSSNDQGEKKLGIISINL